MSWLPLTAEGETPIDGVFNLRADLYEKFKDFYFQLWNPPKIDPVILELCRLRIAQLHGCQSEEQVRYEPARAAGLTDEKIGVLANWRETEIFTMRERACLVFAENFALAVHCIGDDEVAELSRHFDAKQIVALCEAVALFDGFSRFRVILGVQARDGVVDPEHSRLLY